MSKANATDVNFHYKCKKCKKTFNIKTDTFLQDSNLLLSQIALLCYADSDEFHPKSYKKKTTKFFQSITGLSKSSVELNLKNIRKIKKTRKKGSIDKKIIKYLTEYCESKIQNQANITQFFNWAGSKKNFIHDATTRLPKEFNNYYEPFLGGGSLFFAMFQNLDLYFNKRFGKLYNIDYSIEDRRDKVFNEGVGGIYISDYSSVLIDNYKAIANNEEEIIQFIKEYNKTLKPLKVKIDQINEKRKDCNKEGRELDQEDSDLYEKYKQEFESFYNEMISRFDELSETNDKNNNKTNQDFYPNYQIEKNPDLAEQVALFITISKNCYHSLVKIDGRRNVSSAGYCRIVSSDGIKNIKDASYAVSLDRVYIANIKYQDIEPRLKAGDFVYLDPPYDIDHSKKKQHNYCSEFDHKDQVELRDFMTRMKDKGVYCMMANYATDNILDLYSDEEIFNVSKFAVSRANTGKNKTEWEVLVCNY